MRFVALLWVKLNQDELYQIWERWAFHEHYANINFECFGQTFGRGKGESTTQHSPNIPPECSPNTYNERSVNIQKKHSQRMLSQCFVNIHREHSHERLQIVWQMLYANVFRKRSVDITGSLHRNVFRTFVQMFPEHKNHVREMFSEQKIVSWEQAYL